MATSNFNVRMDNTLRDQASEVLSSYGLTASQAVKMFFKQIVKTNSIPLSLDYNDYTVRPEVAKELLETRANERTPNVCKNNQELIEMIKAD